MTVRGWLGLTVALAAACGALGACSSSSGGGSSPPSSTTIVLPPGARTVCADGSAPPCR